MSRRIHLRKKQSSGKFLTAVIITLIAVTTSSLLFLYLFYLYFTHDLPDLTEITGYKPHIATEVYSANGTLIGEFASDQRKLIPYEEIPNQVKNAFIAVEDKRFFEHEGVDFRRIIGALLKNIQEGEIVQGASTITQQVAKNLVLSPERSVSRKIKEAILAYRMENNLSKEEILYIYLNHIYLGDGTYGIEGASENYFGKSSKDINLAEAALLAGLPKAPEYYSPRRHLNRAIDRQRLVLDIMKEEGIITEQQRERASRYEIEIVPRRNLNLEVAPYFVEFVRQYLIDRFGTESFIKGGYKVFTTIDVDLSLEAGWALRRGILDIEAERGRDIVSSHFRTQQSIDQFRKSQEIKNIEVGKSYLGVITGIRGGKTAKTFIATVGIGKWLGELGFAVSSPLGNAVEGLYFPTSEKYAPLNGYQGVSLVPSQLKVGDVIWTRVTDDEEEAYQLSIDYNPQTQGALLAMDTNGYVKALVGGFSFRDSQFNRAIQAQRQPGSSFKPIVYAAAIDKGYTETTVVHDVPIVIKDWAPQNYDNVFLGEIPLREALAKSRNLASIGILMDIDPGYAVNSAKRFGFGSHLNPYPSLVLGGSDVRLIEMVTAFNVFASGGRLVDPKFILRIYDRNGRLVEDSSLRQQYMPKEDMEKAEREKKRIEILKQIAKAVGGYDPKTEFIEEKEINRERSDGNRRDEFQTPEEFLRHLRENKSSGSIYASKGGEQVLTPETAYIMTDLLQSVVKEGTARSALKLASAAPIGGKTGTTNDFTDAWFIGFSPKIVTGVWVGRDDHKTIGKGATGGKAALPIWNDFMEEALRKFPGGDFGIPDGIQFVSTPYGFIPYKIGSAPDVEDFGITSSDHYKDDHYEDNGDEYGSEIDFLLRR
ncbi:MAG TPA: transglycosylase domain-containing protein [Thermodesulfobacteriota bacterium]|nr:transglycosylase domain-containing protein [Thermodesulfobacteriota bacterium]